MTMIVSIIISGIMVYVIRHFKDRLLIIILDTILIALGVEKELKLAHQRLIARVLIRLM